MAWFKVDDSYASTRAATKAAQLAESGQLTIDAIRHQAGAAEDRETDIT